MINTRKGFTLIELLIVVAIIAILAAIAIPNFLQAQVRARVSSVKSGMHTTATGLESYYVDNNDYPPTYYLSGYPAGMYNYHIPYELTTPIAYLSTLPKDPFETYAGTGAGYLPLKYQRPGAGYSNGSPTSWYVQVPATYPIDDGSATLYKYYGPGNPANDSGCPGSADNIRWAVFSVGPDKEFETAQPIPMRTWYDPTNGVVSNGNLVRISDGNGNYK
jgi:prepilin-type N-terminal cleavage/methylation domain-containing protein